MDLFGDKLKEIRLEKDFSLDQIARETKISRKFLEAIEDNDFSVFPSETYLIGFLRTYTEYLGLDSTRYINQYRNYKIQEQPTPINELLDIKQRTPPLLVIFLIVLGVVALAAGGIWGYHYFFNDSEVAPASLEPVAPPVEEESAKEYYFKDEVNTAWFGKQDKIIVPLGENEYTLLIGEIGEELSFSLGEKSYRLNPGDGLVLNLNDDDSDDLEIILNAIEERDEGLQVNLGLYKVTAAITSTMTNTTRSVAARESAEETVVASAGTDPLEAAGGSGTDVVVIFEAEEPDPFVINITFEGQCLFRYLQDKRNRYQKFFQNNDVLDIDVTSQVVLWISNAGSANARISGKKIMFGKAGQVVTKMIQWRRDSITDKYRLELSSLY